MFSQVLTATVGTGTKQLCVLIVFIQPRGVMPTKNNVGVFRVCFGMRYITKIANQTLLANVAYRVIKKVLYLRLNVSICIYVHVYG